MQLCLDENNGKYKSYQIPNFNCDYEDSVLYLSTIRNDKFLYIELKSLENYRIRFISWKKILQ